MEKHEHGWTFYCKCWCTSNISCCMSFKNYLLLKVSFFQLGFFFKKWKILIKRKTSLLFSLLSFFQQFIDIELSLTYRWTFISGLLRESYKMVKHAKQFLRLYLKIFILNTKKTSWDVFYAIMFFLYYLPIMNLSRCICPGKKRVGQEWLWYM